MKHSKKIIVGSLVSAFAILTVGSFAFFSDLATSSVTGKGGSVNVSISDVVLTNSQNINPGDEDPSVEKTYVPQPGDPLYDANNPNAAVKVSTTPHTLSFDITNNGSKSIRTRQTFVLKVSKDGETLDPRVFSILNSEREELGSNAEIKSYILSDGSEVASVGENDSVAAIKYQIVSDIFDGVGENAETENVSTVKENNGTASQAYSYILSMRKNSKNIYQDANVNIDVIVEAMQFRNTTPEDWKVISTSTITGTTTNEAVSVVPGAE